MEQKSKLIAIEKMLQKVVISEWNLFLVYVSGNNGFYKTKHA